MKRLLSLPFARRTASLQLPVLMLIALLQRTPVLRLLATVESVWVSSSFGQVLKASAVVATMLGAVDTLAGATGFVMNPADPAEATVGVAFNAVFAYSGGPTTVGSYSIANLPPGLSVPNSIAGPGGARTLNDSTGSITGTPTQAGDFIVTIVAFDDPNLGAGTHGSASSTYTISVEAGSTDVAPAITTQPQSQVVVAGASVTFTAAASGTPTPTYQWQKNAVAISGATNSSYTISVPTDSDSGNYRVIATNSVSAATSDAAMLTVITAPSSAIVTFTVE